MTSTHSKGGSAGTAGGASRRRPFRSRQALTLLAFMLPAIVFVCWFTYWPMLQGARMAFHDWNLWDLTSTPWVGFDNFVAVFQDPLFPQVAWNTVLGVVGSLVPQRVIGFLIALVLRVRRAD